MAYPITAVYGSDPGPVSRANVRAYHLIPVEDVSVLRVKVSATVITPFGSKTFYQEFTAADLVALANLVVSWLGGVAISFRVPLGAGGTDAARAEVASAILAAGGYIQPPV